MDFLYCGEANVYQENLDSFLAIAEELQLRGLMGKGEDAEGGGEIQGGAAKMPKRVKEETNIEKFAQKKKRSQRADVRR